MIINAHEYPSDQAVRNQRELGIDMSILLPVVWHCGTVEFRAEFGRPHKAR